MHTPEFRVVHSGRCSGEYPSAPLAYPVGAFKDRITRHVAGNARKILAPIPAVVEEVDDADATLEETGEEPSGDPGSVPPPPAPYGVTSAEIPRDEPALAAPLRAPTDGVDLSDLGLTQSDKSLYEATIDMIAFNKGRITKVVHQVTP